MIITVSLGELYLEYPAGKGGLDDVSSVEAVHAVDSEDAGLLHHLPVLVNPEVAHPAHQLLHRVQQQPNVLEPHTLAVLVEVEGDVGEAGLVVHHNVLKEPVCHNKIAR